jgi:hypothetical protein
MGQFIRIPGRIRAADHRALLAENIETVAEP